MTKDKVQKKILAIAEGMKPGDAPLTRADLAYELKDLGVEGDTPEIAKWVWESYTASGKNEKVRRAFVSNAGSRSLVDVYRMTFELESGNDEKALSLMADGANDAAMALAELKEDVRGALAKETTEAVSSLIALVSGTGGVESAKQEAGAVFDRYSRLVASYDQARERVQGVAADFVTVRGDIEKTYRRYVMALVDVFGDSVKTIAPEMFDFGSIKWLDVQGMLQKAELQYTTVSTRCSTLMGEISDSFRKRVSEASDAIRATGGGNAGLILAGLAMVSHYADAASKTANVKADIVRLRNDIRRDATNIQADMLRLVKIFKTLNDLHLPRANVFYRHAGDILGKELQGLLDAFYATPAAKSLRNRRERLLADCEEIDRKMQGVREDVDYYQTHIRECHALLEGMKGQYDEARASKPPRPFFLANLLTLGGAGRSFNRRLYDWNKVCGPVVSQFNALREDVELDCGEKAGLEKSLKEDEAKAEALRRELADVNAKLRSAIRTDPAARAKLLGHLKDIVALLRVAKDILESGLDAKDIETVKIEDQGGLELPETVSRNLELFKQVATDQIRAAGKQIVGELDALANDTALADDDTGDEEDNADDDGETDGEDEDETSPGKNERRPIRATGLKPGEVTSRIASGSADATEKLAGLFNSWLELEALRAAEHKNKLAYAGELARIKKEFGKAFSAIDDKAEALGRVMAQINTAATDEDRKKGLMMLADVGEDWSDSDWEQFLAGDKTTTL